MRQNFAQHIESARIGQEVAALRNFNAASGRCGSLAATARPNRDVRFTPKSCRGCRRPARPLWADFVVEIGLEGRVGWADDFLRSRQGQRFAPAPYGTKKLWSAPSRKSLRIPRRRSLLSGSLFAPEFYFPLSHFFKTDLKPGQCIWLKLQKREFGTLSVRIGKYRSEV